MKTPTTTKAKATTKTSPAKKTIKSEKKAETKPEKKNETLANFTVQMSIGTDFIEAQGNDYSVFGLLKMPKIMNKCIVKIINNKNNKSFEVVFPPLIARKLTNNEFVQVFQWKRLVGKVS